MGGDGSAQGAPRRLPLGVARSFERVRHLPRRQTGRARWRYFDGGLDFALTVAAELAGEDFAQQLQLALEYAPAPTFDSSTPETAPPAVLAAALKAAARLKL
jgi:hypothetical protein